MKLSKETRVCLLLGAALLLTILLPPGFSALGDQRLIGRLVTQPLNERSAEQAPASLVDKLNLIASYNNQQSESVVMASQRQTPEDKSYSAEPFLFALEGLKRLRENEAFPQVNLDTGYQRAEYKLHTYMDMAQPAMSAQVWELPLYTESFNAYVWMDAESHQIYQFYLGSGRQEPEAIDQESFIRAWGDYLGLTLLELTIKDAGTARAVYQAGEKTVAYVIAFGDGRSLEVNLDDEQ